MPSSMATDPGLVIVLDSSFLIAFHNRRDVHHGPACRAMPDLIGGGFGRLLLLEYVFLEVVTVLLARCGHAITLDVADTLLNSQEVDFLPCSELFQHALDVFRTTSTARLSFTDAAIVAAARRHETKFVATFDEGFRRIEGLTLVPG